MKRWIAAGIIALILTGCTRYEPSEEMTMAEESRTEPETGQAQEAAEPGEGKGNLCVCVCGGNR